MPVPLCRAVDAAALRAITRQTKDGPQARRLLALAATKGGKPHRGGPDWRGHGADRARLGGEVRIKRPWGRGAGSTAGGGASYPSSPTRIAWLPGPGSMLGPDPGYRWRGALALDRSDPVRFLGKSSAITISKQTLGRELRAMDYRKLSARPRHHAKNEAAVSAFKKTFRPVWRRSGRRFGGKPIEIRFADEARIGQKNKITRRWAKRGNRPSAPKDQRTAFGLQFRRPR